MVIFDHINKTIAAVAHAHVPGVRGQESGVSHEELRRAYQAACDRVDRLVERLQQGVADLQLTDVAPVGEVTQPYRSNFEPAAFEAAVAKCIEYIKAGDIFQIVLSQRLQTRNQARPFDIYRDAADRQSEPVHVLLESRSCSVWSAVRRRSWCRVEGDQVTIRPLAGTRRRGRTEEEDDRLAAELLRRSQGTGRAHHAGRSGPQRRGPRGRSMARVQLSDVMSVERYSHVMHIMQQRDAASLPPGKTAFDALRACLPAGTVSGAPKVRAMEIIDELEPHRRGPYGGAVGYVDFSGNMDTCIALRTMVLKGQTAYVQAGAGIVADSVPANECEETLNKARGLLRALEMAELQL